MNNTPLLLATVQRARQAYPLLPYHNVQHMDDVVQMTKELIRLVPRYTFSAQQQELLVIAAAWHDAGYDHAAANAHHLAKTGEVTKGGRYKRAANIATAAFAIVAARGNPRWTRFADGIAAGIVAATTVPHLRGVGKPTGKQVRRL